MAFAVVAINGTQEKVEKGAKLSVPFMAEKKEGDKVTFDQVLLLNTDKEAKVGKPYVAGAAVEAKVMGHGKGEKIRVFKMKHRKRTRSTQGHRQWYTEIEIVGIKG